MIYSTKHVLLVLHVGGNTCMTFVLCVRRAMSLMEVLDLPNSSDLVATLAGSGASTSAVEKRDRPT